MQSLFLLLKKMDLKRLVYFDCQISGPCCAAKSSMQRHA